MNHELKKLPKNTFEITLSVPWTDIEKEFVAEFKKLQDLLQVEGFRKGKAPKDVAKKYIKKEAVFENVVRAILPKLYQDILTKEGLQPITQPRIELIKAKENENWEIKITLATKPAIKLNNYKAKIKDQKTKGKKDDIWVPGKDKTAGKEAPSEDEARQKQLNEVLGIVLKEVELEVPDIIIESELESRLAQLVDDVQKIGLTTENYLKSKNLTMDELKKRYKKEIEDTYRLEFILQHIADEEKIEVAKEDLDKIFSSITDEKEKQNAQANSYYYASILRKQKTLDFLTSL